MHTLHPENYLDLAGVDWQNAWVAEDALRSKPSTASQWSRRASSYGTCSLGEYERAFLELAGIKPGETVLDFGCGIGLLSVPLAKMGCRVIACDFAQGMLDELRKNAQVEGVSDRIDARLIAWDDDWKAAGLAEDCVDVAVASRSLATCNLLDALVKLDHAARRKVCVTVAAGRSPRRDERAFAAVGKKLPGISDYVFCANVLFQHGVFPQISYIVTQSRPAFAGHDEAFESLTDMLGGDLSVQQQLALEAFLQEHYAFDTHAHPDRCYAADELREVRWAFISW